MQTATPTARTGPAAPHAAGRHTAPHKSAFRTLLSELNPLQYLPVVGTIYRAVTGDTIPESARFAGSLVVSGLTGGPVGLALNVGATALEHVLGIDPEKISTGLLASLGIGDRAPTPLVASGAPVSVAAVDQVPGASPGTPAAPAQAWSAAQLTAYGVSSTGGGMVRGSLSGADVLNSLELARIGAPSLVSAYA